VNLAPADLPKESGRFDLPIALGILIASQQLPTPSKELEFAGELALDGQLRPIRGALAMAVAAHAEGRTLVLPIVSAKEASLHPEASILSAPSLSAVCTHILGRKKLDFARPSELSPAASNGSELLPDLADVRGQQQACQALIAAAAGGHSLLFHGAPGCGKTLLAERLPGILPPMTPQEALDSAVNRSLAALPIDARRWQIRPFRRPHHTTPALAITGGGNPIRPGEISLAHQGVLFLDELPEFSRSSLEALREPLESGEVCISRVAGAEILPARFQLLATMNPCPCGRGQDDPKPCRCSEAKIQAYRARVSAPILDRIDLWVPVPKETSSTSMMGKSNSGEWDSKSVREKVIRARDCQLARQGCENARLMARKLIEVAALSTQADVTWNDISRTHRLSPRGAHR
jgi:magnesium chelatase family protein